MSIWTKLFEGRGHRPPVVRTRLSLERLNGRDVPSTTLPDTADRHAPGLSADIGPSDPITVVPLADLTASTAGIGDDKKDPKKEEPKKEEPKKEDEQKHETKGMKGRKLTDAEKKEFDAFGDRAKKLGLIENPNRTGEWGKMVDGKFQRVTRIDVAEPGKPGWRGKTHIHVYDDKGEGGEDHLDPKTPIPGEPEKE